MASPTMTTELKATLLPAVQHEEVFTAIKDVAMAVQHHMLKALPDASVELATADIELLTEELARVLQEDIPVIMESVASDFLDDLAAQAGDYEGLPFAGVD